jgi:hypothetical protein
LEKNVSVQNKTNFRLESRLQYIGASRWLILVILVSGFGAAFGAILSEAVHDDQLPNTRGEAEEFANRISREIKAGARKPEYLVQKSKLRNQSGEELSKKGELGRDVWGHSFQYQLGRSGDSDFVVVWSSGPNGLDETKISELFQQHKRDPSALIKYFHFTGDDLGAVVPL